MALNSGKSGFGFDMESKFSKASKPDKETTAARKAVVKENRDRKVQCLFRPSVWDGRLDAMAQATGETKNELLNRALEAYLEQNGF